ncbi:hypothetical protein [Haladaptatus sp. CMAA 1911]|uniref:hypothetical protein n=1 Tax=unclassified Haladaptatus TaxID=2622732 RepID=UPI003754AED8
MHTNRELLSVFLIFTITFSGCLGAQSAYQISNVENKRTINNCTSINKPGHYELKSNITNGGGTGISKSCIKIRSGNVVLDGNGHTISGRGNSHTTGVQVITSKTTEGVKIQNLSLTDWHNGVEFRQATVANIQNVEASSNVFGISVENVTRAQIKWNTIQNNTVGIRVGDGIEQLEVDKNSYSNNEVDLL